MMPPPLVVAVHMLIDGRRTYARLAAFAPTEHRARVDQTAARALDVVAACIRGNLITSGLCAVITWIALGALVALPLAAMHPCVEQIWIRNRRDAERA